MLLTSNPGQLVTLPLDIVNSNGVRTDPDNFTPNTGNVPGLITSDQIVGIAIPTTTASSNIVISGTWIGTLFFESSPDNINWYPINQLGISTVNTLAANIVITGTWTGTLYFESTIDNINWVTLSSSTVNTVVNITNNNYLQVRVRGTNITGTPTVTLSVTPVPNQIAANPVTGVINVNTTTINSSTINPFFITNNGYSYLRVRGNNLSSGIVNVNITNTPGSSVSGIISPTQNVNINIPNGLISGNVFATISGTWSGTLALQGTSDGINWTTLNINPITTNGVYSVNFSGYTKIQVIGNSLLIGTAVVSLTINAPQITNILIPSNITNTTGNITSNQSVVINTTGTYTTVNISGSWSGDILFEATTDGVNWFNIQAQNQFTGTMDYSSDGVNGTWVIANESYLQVKVVGNLVTGGQAVITLIPSTAPYITDPNFTTPIPLVRLETGLYYGTYQLNKGSMALGVYFIDVSYVLNTYVVTKTYVINATMPFGTYSISLN
jgi:hypothetical protein